MKIILFGAGVAGIAAMEYYGADNVECFADNDLSRDGEIFHGKEVVSFERFKKIAKAFRVIVSSENYYTEIGKQLEENEIKGYSIYLRTHKRAIDRLKNLDELQKFQNVALYGIDSLSKYFITDVLDTSIGEWVKYITDDDNIRDKIFGFTICSLDEVISDVDCVIITSEVYNRILHKKLVNKYGKKIEIINPFKQMVVGEIDKIVVNPYLGLNKDRTEEEWNRLVAKSNDIKATNDFVEFVKNATLLPEHIEIETINKCNGVCQFCPVNKNADTRETKLMSIELFKSIVDQLVEISFDGRLALFSNNEPLLDERIVVLSKYAKERLPWANIILLSNGTLFTIQKFVDLIQYLDELIIDNYTSDLTLTRPSLEIKEYVEKHSELLSKVTIVLRKPNDILTTRGGDAPNRSQQVSYGDEKCALPFTDMIIRPDGKVSLCCNDPLGRDTLGDLTNESILDVWYGEKYQEVRAAISKGRKYWKHCEFCDTFGVR